MNKPLTVPKYTRREILIGICIGLFVLLGTGYGIVKIWGDINHSMLSGAIVAKHLVTLDPEHRISLGKSGLNLQQVESQYYIFEIQAQGQIFLVKVNKTAYGRHEVGDTFKFSRPIEGEESAALHQALGTLRQD